MQEYFAPSFWSTQGITGHGVYKDYLIKGTRADDNTCPYGLEVKDAEHVMLDCIRFKDVRPFEWHETTVHHIDYMSCVVITPWKLENSNFKKK